jgi:hypothetical protein
MKKVAKVLIVGLIVLGMAIAILNFVAPSLSAVAGGWVEKRGTFPEDELLCPGEPTNCVHRIYVEEPTG